MPEAEPIQLLYVATDLEYFQADSSWRLAIDFGFNGKPFRSLDAAYYCWIRRQMEKAHHAFKAGKLSTPAWETLRDRFTIIHAWAVYYLGLETLNAAHASFAERAYQPPGKEQPYCPVEPMAGMEYTETHDGKREIQKRPQRPAARAAARNPEARQQSLFVDPIE